MNARRVVRIGVTALLPVALLAATGTPAHAAARRGTVLFSESFEAHPAGTWLDGTVHGGWRAIYNGYGTVGIQTDGSKVLYQSPAVSTTPSVTHAGLTRTSKTFGNIDLTLRMKTVRQLRTPTPNPWETGWVLWSYADNTHFYYLALKTNGWELGKADPAYPGAQRFLATGSFPTYPAGVWNSVRVVQVGNKMSVYANGRLLTHFTDYERAYTSGAVALYNEDAHVRFDDVKVVQA